MTDDNSESELDRILHSFGWARGYDSMLGQSKLAEAHNAAKAAILAWHHQQLEAKVAEALDLVLKKAPRDMRVLDEKTYPTAYHRVIGINAANSDWRGAITLVRALLTSTNNKGTK